MTESIKAGIRQPGGHLVLPQHGTWLGMVRVTEGKPSLLLSWTELDHTPRGQVFLLGLLKGTGVS